MSDQRRVVVGVGNRFRRDDSAGLEVAELLRERVARDVQVRTLEGEPTTLLDVLADAELTILVDAVATAGRPGEICRFDATHEPVPNNVFGASTHAFGLGETIELARTLGRLNGRVLVYGITGEDFGAGEALSATVATAVQTAAAAILQDLSGPAASSAGRKGATHA
jgi:hydrogenase maturation protease